MADEVIGGKLKFLLETSNASFKRGIKEAKDELGKFSNTIEKHRKTIKAVGTALTVFGAAVTAAFAMAAKSAINFNKSLANVQTLMPKNIKRVEEFRSAIQKMSIAVNKSTADLTEGMYQVISAFGDTSDSVKVLEINAKAAAAGLSSTLDAINLTSAVTKGYGDTSAEAVQHVADLAFQTVKLGQTTFPELAASLGIVVPQAAELGVKLEEVFGVMATGTGVTGNASMVATQFRGILTSLMNPTQDMIDLFQKYGEKTDITAHNMLKKYGVVESLKLLRMEQKEGGKQLTDYIGRVEGQILALALTGAQATTYTEKLKEM